MENQKKNQQQRMNETGSIQKKPNEICDNFGYSLCFPPMPQRCEPPDRPEQSIRILQTIDSDVLFYHVMLRFAN